MKHNNWITLADAESEYGININVVQSSHSKNTDGLKYYRMGKDTGGYSMINISYLLYIYDLRMRAWNAAHDIYFKLMEYGNDSQLSKIFAKRFRETFANWSQFFNNRLFMRVDNYSLTRTSMPPKLYQFLSFGAVLLRRLEIDKETP